MKSIGQMFDLDGSTIASYTGLTELIVIVITTEGGSAGTEFCGSSLEALLHESEIALYAAFLKVAKCCSMFLIRS